MRHVGDMMDENAMGYSELERSTPTDSPTGPGLTLNPIGLRYAKGQVWNENCLGFILDLHLSFLPLFLHLSDRLFKLKKKNSNSINSNNNNNNNNK